MTPLRRIPPRAAPWLVAGWIVFWAVVAWSVWHFAWQDRDLYAHARRTSGVVLVAGPQRQVRFSFCQQVLHVSPRVGSTDVTVSTTRGCGDPIVSGDVLELVVDRRDPARAVLADDVLSPAAVYGLPVLLGFMTATVAGYPLGRLALARRTPSS